MNNRAQIVLCFRGEGIYSCFFRIFRDWHTFVTTCFPLWVFLIQGSKKEVINSYFNTSKTVSTLKNWLQQDPVLFSKFCHFSNFSLINTVDSRYIEVEGILWNTSRYPYFDISDFQNWGKYKMEQSNFTNEYVIRLLQLEIYIENNVGKGEKLLLLEAYSFF